MYCVLVKDAMPRHSRVHFATATACCRICISCNQRMQWKIGENVFFFMRKTNSNERHTFNFPFGEMLNRRRWNFAIGGIAKFSPTLSLCVCVCCARKSRTKTCFEFKVFAADEWWFKQHLVYLKIVLRCEPFRNTLFNHYALSAYVDVERQAVQFIQRTKNKRSIKSVILMLLGQQTISASALAFNFLSLGFDHDEMHPYSQRSDAKMMISSITVAKMMSWTLLAIRIKLQRS